VLHPKDGSERRGVLVFTRFIDEADELKEKLRVKGVKADIVTGTTPKREREDILAKFKIGLLKVVVNVGTLTTGFDYPELDTIILGRPTKSLALYYQMVGRAIRPYKGKDAWIVDLGGSYKFFGRVDELKIECPPGTSRWVVTSRGRPLTNVNF
jgi:DNA repair protein RadD